MEVLQIRPLKHVCEQKVVTLQPAKAAARVKSEGRLKIKGHLWNQRRYPEATLDDCGERFPPTGNKVYVYRGGKKDRINQDNNLHSLQIIQAEPLKSSTETLYLVTVCGAFWLELGSLKRSQRSNSQTQSGHFVPPFFFFFCPNQWGLMKGLLFTSKPRCCSTHVVHTGFPSLQQQPSVTKNVYAPSAGERFSLFGLYIYRLGCFCWLASVILLRRSQVK